MPVSVLAPQRGSAIVEDGLELLAAFSQIADPVVRRTVITMVQGLRPVRRTARWDEGEADLAVSVRGRQRAQK